MKVKRIWISVLMLIIIFSGVAMADNGITVVIDGDKVTFEDQRPVIVHGRTLVPMRKIFESLGMVVNWDDKERKATGEYEEKKIEIQIGSSTAKVNDKDVKLDVSAQSINDRVMVPLRFIAESCDMKVSYNDSSKTVNIETIGLTFAYRDGKFGYINKEGIEITEFKYEDTNYFSEGLAPVKLKGKYGYINKNGKEVIDFKFDQANPFTNGIAPVCINNKWGYIDKKGKVIIDFKYEYAIGFSEGLAPVCMNERWGYIDKEGKAIINMKYEFADYFNDGVAVVSANGKDGYINRLGEEITEIKYDQANTYNFSEGLAVVYLDGKCGFINKEGKEVIDRKYDIADSFSEGLAAVCIGSKWGYINKEGKVVIDFKYDYGSNFEEGLAEVRLNNKYGYINKEGNVVIEFKYDDGSTFGDGLARVKLDGKWGYINKNGYQISEIKYDMAYCIIDGLGLVCIDEKWGYVNKEGKLVTELKYKNSITIDDNELEKNKEKSITVEEIIEEDIKDGILSDEDMEKTLIHVTNQVNKKLPMVLDKYTTLDSIMVLGNRSLLYKYTVTDKSPFDGIDISTLSDSMKKISINIIKTSPNTKLYRDNDVKLKYIYYDNEGNYLFEFSIYPKDYK